MASITKRGDSWKVEIWCKGVRKSKSFPTKSEAVAWAGAQENDIRAGHNNTAPPDKTFKDLLEKYRDEVSPTKRGERWEVVRLNLLCRDKELSGVRLSALSAPHVAAWRDRRLAQVSGASVRREWNLLSAACNVAVKEWHWLTENPFRDVKRPDKAPDRTRRVSDDETTLILYCGGYSPDQPPTSIQARVCAAFLFALETAMRAGEICGITPARVHATHVHLPMTKNGHPRDVPLSYEAKRILRQLKDVPGCEEYCFGLTPTVLDATFRKITAKAAIDDLHFHDSRREALTRLSKKLDVMELAKVSGHRDLRMLLNVYYQPKIEDLAAKL